ncbi:MAG: helix-turn-helix domain-containing protein [Thermoanaerobaculia bacterium]|nr:helix-turn-helix domain-containing protein [Thermoanaerobaculia bacterium]
MSVPTADLQSRVPTQSLRPFVDRYLGYRLVGFEPGLHRGLPSRYMTLIVSIGPSINVNVQTNPNRSPASYRCVLGGLQASSAIISHSGNQEGVAIELTPLGSRALLGQPAAELFDLSVELSDLLRPLAQELWERLQSPLPWDQRFDICNEVLCQSMRPRVVDRTLRLCWQALIDSGGAVSVGDLAAAAGWSRQHLTRRFQGEFGLTPKLAARVLRFERAHHRLRSIAEGYPPGSSAARETNLSQVAMDCGYYDQSHFNRDCLDLAGCTPTELVTDEVPFVQDSPSPPSE